MNVKDTNTFLGKLYWGFFALYIATALAWQKNYCHKAYTASTLEYNAAIQRMQFILTHTTMWFVLNCLTTALCTAHDHLSPSDITVVCLTHSV
jgi:hypothetical protein